jgi:hypothetical protein
MFYQILIETELFQKWMLHIWTHKRTHFIIDWDFHSTLTSDCGSSGLLLRVWASLSTSVSDKHTASIFNPKDGGSIFVRNAGWHTSTRLQVAAAQRTAIWIYFMFTVQSTSLKFKQAATKTLKKLEIFSFQYCLLSLRLRSHIRCGFIWSSYCGDITSCFEVLVFSD